VDVTFEDSHIDSMHNSMKRYADIGVEVMITEIDVRCRQGKEPCPVEIWTDSMLERQAEIYSNILQVCLE
jgi:GH35 family endo-1,4-beta-xylanase